MQKILPFEMCDPIFSSPWIHHLNINAYSTANPNHSRNILQCHICMAKGCALDGETVWTDTQLCPSRLDDKYVNFLQKRLSQSLSFQTMCFGSQNCPADLSTALLQVSGGGTARIETLFEFHRLGPKQDLEHFLHFQPMCQWVLCVHLFLPCTALTSEFIFQNSCASACFLTLVSR